MRSIRDFELEGKRVLLRCDLNVPFEDGKILDDFRLEESVPTIRYISEQKGRCIILAHFGRPEAIPQKEFSLEPIAECLQGLVKKEIKFIGDSIGEKVEEQIAAMKIGDVVLLENVRFYKGEEENDPAFAKLLAGLGEIYINDAFGVCHRAHASVVGIPRFLSSGAGLLLEKEIVALGKISEWPEKPLIVVVGGTKVETKVSFLAAISKNANAILLGNLISKEVKEKGLQVAENTELVYAIDGIDGDFDLGPETIRVFQEKIQGAKTIFWAGPLGRIEEQQYENGSLAIANAIIQSGAFAIAGGGDLAGFLGKHGLREKFDHVSTGGGAMLAFLSGEKLPGLEALNK
ncbi:MAG: phosphoglycerate kinase [Patescibacteria group bacterium]